LSALIERPPTSPPFPYTTLFRSEHSITDVETLLAELATIRERGYAIDEGEQEIGVRCYAVPVPEAPTPTALSVSGPDSRVTDAFGERAVPLLQRRAAEISAALLHD